MLIAIPRTQSPLKVLSNKLCSSLAVNLPSYVLLLLLGAPMQAAIEDTLYAAKVDMVFSGHVHAYERSCRVYRYKCVADAPYYITIGSND